MNIRSIILFLSVLLLLSISARSQDINYRNSILWTDLNELRVTDNYACCAFQNGLAVMDISDPQNPTIISQLYLPGESKDIAIDGFIVFVAGGRGGVFILDITNPEQPVLLGTCEIQGYDISRIFISGDFAYVSDLTYGLFIVDVSDRTNPSVVGQYHTTDNIEGTYVDNNIAYVTISASGLDIVDISDRSNPQFLANFDDTLYHATDVAIYDDYAFICENSSDFRILDVSDPANPVYIGREWYHLRAKDMEIKDTYAYTVNPEFGVEIYDISNPEDVVYLTESPLSGRYLESLHIASDMVYVVEKNVGFHMIDITQPSNPVYTGLYQQDVENVLVEGNSDYAFVRYEGGIRILDVTDPDNMQVIGDLDISGDYIDTKLEGNILFVIRPQGISIYDVSNPLDPISLGGCFISRGIQNYFFCGSRVYVVYISHESSHGFGIYECYDPTNPHLVGEHNTSAMRSGIGVANGIAFVQAWSYVELYDVSDPENIRYLRNFDITVGSEMYSDGDYLIATEVPNMKIIDVTDRDNPVLAGTCNISGLDNLFIGSDYAVASCGPTGIALIDISDITSPQIAGRYNTPGDAVDAYLSDGNIIVADGSSVMSLSMGTTGIDPVDGDLPGRFGLAHAYPNPFNASTTIRYSLSSESDVLLEVYDILGRKVETLVAGIQQPGEHSVIWDADNLPSGTYFYRLKTADQDQSRKLILLK